MWFATARNGLLTPPHAAPPAPPAGLFTLSLVAAAEERHLLSALLFSLLLCLKHIFLYAAPAFFVFLLRRYCRGPHAVLRFGGLGAIVLGTFGLVFGPFVAAGQLPQVCVGGDGSLRAWLLGQLGRRTTWTPCLSRLSPCRASPFATAAAEALPLRPRAVPRLLGAQRVGAVCGRR